MRLPALSLVTLTAALHSTPALGFGNSNNPLTDMLMVAGSCSGRIELFGNKAGSTSCKQMSNTVYKDGRTGFYFVTENYLLTFSGVAPQVTTSPNSAVQPVDLVLFNETKNGNPNQPIKLRAAGTCAFANPFLGIPAVFDCEAETPKGRFAAKFMSDGSEPVIMIKNGQMLKKEQ